MVRGLGKTIDWFDSEDPVAAAAGPTIAERHCAIFCEGPRFLSDRIRPAMHSSLVQTQTLAHSLLRLLANSPQNSTSYE